MPRASPEHARERQRRESAPAAFTAAGAKPASARAATPTSVCKRHSGSNTRIYRCSKCGKVGHNIRSCPTPSSTWYRQRCSICGQPGHNARNCNARFRCRVCNGSGKLKCSKCGGGGDALTRLLASKRKIARVSGGAVFFDSKEGDGVLVDKDGRIGGKSVTQVRMAKKMWGENGASAEHEKEELVCSRCLGTGYLTCMACAADDG